MRFATGWLIVVGLVARIAPLFDQGGRLLRQFPTEDGFLMMTAARNLAAGRGLSIAEGWIPTNGVQPLFTFVEALAFAAVGGDRRDGVLLILVISAVLAGVAALVLRRLLAGLLAGRPDGRALAALAAALWFASPLSVYHTMNGLETGLYALCVLAALLAWFEGGRTHGRAAATGALLGVAFWARNDAVFLMAAVGLAELMTFGVRGRDASLALRRLGLMAATALATAAPWPLHNFLAFGHPIPSSGSSQELDAAFSGNLVEIPTKLFEYLAVVAPVPETVETRLPVVLFTAAVCLAGLAAAVRICRRAAPRARAVGIAALIYGALLAGYYGLFFGAPWFVGRYLFPISPFATALAVILCADAVRRLPAATVRLRPVLVSMGIVLLLATALNVRIYVNGPSNRYWHLVEWIETHVAPEDWVGSMQSGTIGFFHDRTVNLDGKVNPHALAARRTGSAADYAATVEVGDPPAPLSYIVDWIHIARWLEEPGIAARYRLVLEDPAADIAVLGRRDD